MIYNQNFDSYSDGDLNGQDSWVTSSGVTHSVGSAYALGGSVKGVRSLGSGMSSWAYHPVSMVSGIQRVIVKVGQTDKSCQYGLRESGETIIDVYPLGNGDAYLRSGANSVLLISSVASNTEYTIDIDFDLEYGAGNGRCRARVNGGTWTDYINIDVTCSVLNEVFFYSPIDATLIFDEFSDQGIVGPANLKTLGGLAKESIKEVGGLAIASLKSIGGLS